MEDLLLNPDFEFMRPLVTGWISKLESADRYRKQWKELADECMMFYSKSAAAMWDPTYSRKFWQGIKSPKFRITINKPFEFVAVFGPNLLWETPHRTVEHKRLLAVTAEDLPQDQMLQMVWQMMEPLQQHSEQSNLIVSKLMQGWLNYTPREQPGGGLIGHSEMAALDAMIKGRGATVTRPYTMPGSGRVLTGAFREPPENLLYDPDFKSVNDAKWMAIKHTDPHWVVERKFKLPAGSLKERATAESSWTYSELQTGSSAADASMHRAAGSTNDLIVWYEIYSKTGPGARMTGMPAAVRDHLEEQVGDYAYLAISAQVPYPLNCPSSVFRSGGSNNKGATSAEIKRKFAWPIPMWRDDKFPVQLLDFYPDPDHSWPVPPLAPAMGELKLLNFLVPWLANRIWSSSRDFWAVAAPHVEQYEKYLREGEDQSIIPTPLTVDDVRKAIMVLQQPETRQDAWKIVELVSMMFDKRTGLTEHAYGRNEGGTQDRTAETTLARERAVGVRPEHMQKKVVAWQSEVAACEGAIARMFVKGKDVQALMGPAGRFLWERFVETADQDAIMREFQYTVSASSIRRPNRDRDMANYQQAMQIFAPLAQLAYESAGDPQPINFLMHKWGEMHDVDLSGAQIQPPPPPQPDPAEQQKMEAEMQKLQMEAQTKQQESQAKLQQIEAQTQAKQMQAEIDLQKTQLQLEFDQQRSAMELSQDQQRHEQELMQGAQQHRMQLAQAQQQGQQTLQQSEQMSEAKVAAMKAQAKAKPKTTTKA